MSARAINWVLSLRGISHVWKVILLVLADRADTKGRIVEDSDLDCIAADACVGRRTAAENLPKMALAGLIVIENNRVKFGKEKGRQSSNYYMLCLPPKEDVLSAAGALVEADSRVRQPHSNRVHPTTSPSAPAALSTLYVVKALKPSLLPTDSQDLETAQLLWSKVLAIFPNHKPPKLKTWANDIRLIREQDGRTYDQIVELFSWANNDTFWQKNIRSPEKLRAKWDDLDVRRSGAASQVNADPADAGCERIHPDTRLRCGNHPARRNLNRQMMCDACWNELLGNNVQGTKNNFKS